MVCWIFGVTIGIFSIGFFINMCYKMLCSEMAIDDDSDLDKYFADDVSIFYELHFYIKQDQKCTMSMENDFLILLFVHFNMFL